MGASAGWVRGTCRVSVHVLPGYSSPFQVDCCWASLHFLAWTSTSPTIIFFSHHCYSPLFLVCDFERLGYVIIHVEVAYRSTIGYDVGICIHRQMHGGPLKSTDWMMTKCNIALPLFIWHFSMRKGAMLSNLNYTNVCFFDISMCDSLYD